MITGIMAIVASISGILNKIIPDADKRLEVQGEIERALIANQGAIYTAMKDVMAADAASESWAARNARPFTVFWCLGMMTWVVIAPAFGLQAQTIASVKAIPADLWNLSAYGIGAYILGKSGVDIAKALKK
jgi:hypothetical protein